MNSGYNLLTMPQLENMTNTTAEDRTSHAHLSRGVGLEGWPMPRSKCSLADIKTAIVADPQDYSRSTTIPSPTRRHMLPGPNLTPKKEATLNKRKGSVSDLGLGPMTTVQEGCLDSRRLLRLSWPGKKPLTRYSNDTWPSSTVRKIYECSRL